MRTLLASAILCSVPFAAHASFHLMQIEQVAGGVDGDTTAQAIQLRMRAPMQRYLQSDAGGTHGPARLIAYDAAGTNPVTLIVFPNDVASGNVGDRVLIVSPNFTSHIASAPVPDFTMTSVIPASYLAAGRIDYTDNSGTVLWSLSFGGGNYTGPLAATSFNGSFGSPFAGPLPTSGSEALQFQGVDTAASLNNATDYQLTASAAVFVNNNRANFQLPAATMTTAQVSITAIRPQTSEAGGPRGVFRVTRTGDTSTDLAVNYRAGGSAAGGTEYQALGNSVVIPTGKTSAKIKIIALDDGDPEVDTKVKVTLLPGSGYTVGSPSKAKVQIVDVQ